MNDVFRKFLDKFFVYYLYNILIYFKNIEKHEDRVRLMLQKLQDIELYAKLEKCTFYQLLVKFLGYIISNLHQRIFPSTYSFDTIEIQKLDEIRTRSKKKSEFEVYFLMTSVLIIQNFPSPFIWTLML